MDAKSVIATQGYEAMRSAAGAPAQPDAAGGPSFLERFASDAVQTLRNGEAAAQDALLGKADAHSVVEALAASELAIETAVTVRDKVVEAYQEILRMPV